MQMFLMNWVLHLHRSQFISKCVWSFAYLCVHLPGGCIITTAHTAVWETCENDLGMMRDLTLLDSLKMELFFLLFWFGCLLFGGNCSVEVSEFHREGDFVIGGLFNIHQDEEPQIYHTPEALQCSRWVNTGKQKRQQNYINVYLETTPDISL